MLESLRKLHYSNIWKKSYLIKLKLMIDDDIKLDELIEYIINSDNNINNFDNNDSMANSFVLYL